MRASPARLARLIAAARRWLIDRVGGRPPHESAYPDEALAENERRFRSIFESSGIGVGVAALDGRLVEANSVFARMLGYGREELPGLSIAELTHPDDLPSTLELLERLTAAELDSVQLEKRYLRRDGSVFWGRVTASLLRDASGRPEAAIGVIEDIDERKRAEEAAEKMAAFPRLNPDAVLELAADGSITYANDAAKRMAKALGKGRLEEILPSELNGVLQRLLAGGRNDLRIEKSIAGRTLRCHLFAANSTERVHCYVSDITEAKKAEEALRVSEERFRAVFDSAAVGINIDDVHGHLLATNRAFQEMLGYSEDELGGMTVAAYTHPDDVAVNQRLLRELVDGTRTRFSMEKRYRRKDGEMVWGHLSAAVVRDPEGRPHFAVSVVENITERKLAEEALQESEERFRAMADSAPVLIFTADAEGTMTFMGRGWEELTGVPVEEQLGHGWEQCIHPEDIERLNSAYIPAARTGTPYECEYRLRAADGTYRSMVERGAPLFLPDGRPRGIVAVVVDLTERRQAEEALRTSKERFRTLVSNIPGVVYRCAADADWTMELISDAVEDITGYPASDFLGSAVRTFESVIHSDDTEMVARAVEEGIREGRPFEIEYRIVHADGSVRWVWEKGQGIAGPSGEILWLDGAIFDITDQKHAEAALRRQAELNEYQAVHDSLTGLPNRRLFLDRIGQAILAARREGGGLAVLMMDIDRFKEINDTLGHHSGDLLLRELGARLRATLRASDTVARLGGDEFGVLLPMRAPLAPVARAVERILRAFEQPFVVQGLPLSVEPSIGIALYPEHGEDVEVLLQRADVAMYFAKDSASVYAMYEVERDDYSPTRLRLVGDLRRAMADRELFLHYQPKAALRTGQVAGVEALLRWEHPERGLVPPDEFIPLAQKTGLIKPLTLYVLDEALRQSQEWGRQGRELDVAVNVSMRNLLDVEFPDDVATLLRKWDVQPGRLQLEITESAVVRDPFRAKAVLGKLSGMGLRLSIDDFGTGYSSLAHLKRLPVHEIKIDRSFVIGMTKDEDDEVIVRSIIDLGRSLGLEVVAEGVETEEAWVRLDLHGCAVAQGYFLSPPLPAEALVRWLDEHELSLGEARPRRAEG